MAEIDRREITNLCPMSKNSGCSSKSELEDFASAERNA